MHYVSLNIKNTCVRRGSPYKYVLWNSAQYRKQKILFSHSLWLKHSWSEILGENHHSLKLFKLVYFLFSVSVLEGVVLNATPLCALHSHLSTVLFSLLHISFPCIYLSKLERSYLKEVSKERDATNIY